MATRQQLEELLNNPNARQMLDIIAKAEGVKHGYNTLFGNQRIDSLNSHPNIKKQFKQTDGKTNYTTAAGRYQFLTDTWNNTARQYGLRDFSPRNQDIAALALIKGRGALDQVIKGDFRGAIGKLGKEWASLPSSTYAQPKRSWGYLGLGNGSTSQVPQQQRPQAPQPKFTDLSALGYKPQTQKQAQPQPKFVDLSALGYKGAQQPQPTQQPDFVDLSVLGYKGNM